MKTVYLLLGFAFLGLAGMAYFLAHDLNYVGYTHGFIAAYAFNFYWLQRKLG